MRFTKMHGLGNDYVYVNLFEEAVLDPQALARAVSDRHRGVGSDGLILIGPSQVADVRMTMYNADGTRGEMCGNGLRCVAKYAYEHGLCPHPGAPPLRGGGLIPARPVIRIETDAGVRLAECVLEGGKVKTIRAAMGRPSFVPEGNPRFMGRGEIIDDPLNVIGRVLRGTFVSMGSPHWVVFVSEWSEIDLNADGPALERHEAFPARINVHFAHVDAPQEITMISWERGTGPTQACGSGACAVAAAAHRLGHPRFPTTLHLPGGDLLIEREAGENGGLVMTGSAEEVFTGNWLD